jgi:hypothetical protein
MEQVRARMRPRGKPWQHRFAPLRNLRPKNRIAATSYLGSNPLVARTVPDGK